IWINDQNDPDYSEAPTQMGDPTQDTDWVNDNDDGKIRWNDFVNHFNLKNPSDDSNDGFQDAPYDKKSIYFLPDCEPHPPKGKSGGPNFGIMAKHPVLVSAAFESPGS
ncbi:MAG: hypothetical protein R6X11_01170, partial [Desulfonatronovibrio sp.]